MSRVRKKLPFIMMFVVSIFAMDMTADAKEETIGSGIYVNNIELSGMTTTEAKSAVQTYVDSFGDTQVTLYVGEGQDIVTTAAELGLKWSNPDIVEDAAELGKDGNIVKRYKALKDLEYENKIYQASVDLDKTKIKTLIEEQGVQYNKEAVDAVLTKVGDSFQITEGQMGLAINVDTSADAVYDYLTANWESGDCEIALETEVIEPRGNAEDLAKVKDVLGTFTTSYSTSGSSRSENVINGCRLIDGTTVYPGDEFSAYESVAPFTEANGYYMAGSYLNGQVVDSLGGGICQVSTTLYNTVLQAELDVTERYNHSMIVTYVDPSADAAIAESSGKDFKFVNNTEYPIYIEGITTPDKRITFTIYGVETRDSNRDVRYESVVLETTYPDTEIITTNASLPVGYCSVQSAHIGYKAELWKIVTVDGVEVSREQVNSSSYNKAPRSATVGIATEDPNAYNEIMAAVETNSIDQVKAVAGAYKAAADAAAQQAAESQAATEAAGQPEPVAPDVQP